MVKCQKRRFYDLRHQRQHSESAIFPSYGARLARLKEGSSSTWLLVMLFTLGSAIVAVSKTIGLVIGMRVVQAAGASAVVTIGAATLADIYEPHQRGTMMGVYYSAPLLGPSIGPILGGGLTQGLGWRAVFWLLVICGVILLPAFLFLERKATQEEDKPRKERTLSKGVSKDVISGAQTSNGDVEAQPGVLPVLAIKEVKLSLSDVNPFPPYFQILSRKNNICILISSGLLFAFSFSLTYTCARTLSLYYDYDAMTTGLVLLAYGVGSMLGSILGGRWSDRTLVRLKAANGGVSYPEVRKTQQLITKIVEDSMQMRLESTKLAMPWFPLAVVGYAWACQEHVHVSAICVMLFLSGFFSIWMYASTLAYIVDANVGRSSSAVATNGSFRGLFAFVAAEVAIPLQASLCFSFKSAFALMCLTGRYRRRRAVYPVGRVDVSSGIDYITCTLER
ncbi:major facilitator superfamily domain-containing protein [Chiua virens]|nr:major facilitator superfamily domain-containing protein [Chiua virens]